MGYLSPADIERLGFRHVGRDVRISDRASIYEPERICIGDFSRIDDFCCISGQVTIGRNVHIALGCNVAGGESGITFEDFSGLAYGCHVFA
ncbi:MAG: acyltransferase, partial [Oxalobacteraceae bacterium]